MPVNPTVDNSYRDKGGKDSSIRVEKEAKMRASKKERCPEVGKLNSVHNSKETTCLEQGKGGIILKNDTICTVFQ